MLRSLYWLGILLLLTLLPYGHQEKQAIFENSQCFYMTLFRLMKHTDKKIFPQRRVPLHTVSYKLKLWGEAKKMAEGSLTQAKWISTSLKQVQWIHQHFAEKEFTSRLDPEEPQSYNMWTCNTNRIPKDPYYHMWIQGRNLGKSFLLTVFIVFSFLLPSTSPLMLHFALLITHLLSLS